MSDSLPTVDAPRPNRRGAPNQAAIQRAIRAARKEGAGEVVVNKDGTISIRISSDKQATEDRGLETSRDIVL